jgi:membrane complex biogenesis BtpA family protein
MCVTQGRTHPVGPPIDTKFDARYASAHDAEGLGMSERIDLLSLFGTARPVVGMVHLGPLPGSPRWAGSMDAVIAAAVADAQALDRAGVHGIIVENYGDVPFHRETVPAETVASMAVAATAIRRAVSVRIGINVLRNDSLSALAIAAAAGAGFIRVNVHVGAVLTDQGWIEGRASETLRLRHRLVPDCAILADVAVKHAMLPPGSHLGTLARDAWHRGLPDALIVSGAATGAATSREDLIAVREAVPEARVWIGSGVDEANISALLPHADGVIVGSALSRDGVAGKGVDPDRAERLVRALLAATDA